MDVVFSSKFNPLRCRRSLCWRRHWRLEDWRFSLPGTPSLKLTKNVPENRSKNKIVFQPTSLEGRAVGFSGDVDFADLPGSENSAGWTSGRKGGPHGLRFGKDSIHWRWKKPFPFFAVFFWQPKNSDDLGKTEVWHTWFHWPNFDLATLVFLEHRLTVHPFRRNAGWRNWPRREGNCDDLRWIYA